MADHYHNWQPLGNNKVSCKCDVVTDIETLLHNTKKKAVQDTKIQLLSDQLYKRELKKQAHDAAYTWVMSQNPNAILQPTIPAQSELL
jgi:hypothetical protein